MSQGYFHAIKSRTPSRLWVNNPTLGEIELALAQGAVGCTTNPAYAASVLARAPEEALRIVAECSAIAGNAHSAADLVQERLVARIAERFGSLQRESNGSEGYVSIQGAPSHDDDADQILADGLRARALGPNIAVKVPATLPGFAAFERLVADGTPTIVTEVFSLAQLTYACQTYLAVTDASGHRPAFFVSPITGIFGDHLRAVAASDGIDIHDGVIDLAGIALARACYATVEARSYPVTLLFGGARTRLDFTGLIGGRSASTINYSTVVEILADDPAIEDTIGLPVDPAVVDELKARFAEFALAMSPDGLTPEQFEHFGPVLHFRSKFMDGWEALTRACEAALATAEPTRV